MPETKSNIVVESDWDHIRRWVEQLLSVNIKER